MDSMAFVCSRLWSVVKSESILKVKQIKMCHRVVFGWFIFRLKLLMTRLVLIPVLISRFHLLLLTETPSKWVQLIEIHRQL